MRRNPPFLVAVLALLVAGCYSIPPLGSRFDPGAPPDTSDGGDPGLTDTADPGRQDLGLEDPGVPDPGIPDPGVPDEAPADPGPGDEATPQDACEAAPWCSTDNPEYAGLAPCQQPVVSGCGCQVVQKPALAPCDDGDPCTVEDRCSSDGKCQGRSLDVLCDDGDPCTDDACQDFRCVHTPNTAACDDGNVCTLAATEGCRDGACVPGTYDTDLCGDCDPANDDCFL